MAPQCGRKHFLLSARRPTTFSAPPTGVMLLNPSHALSPVSFQTEDNPRVAQVSISQCSSDMSGYCFHGQCIYLVDMSENHCRCEVGYTGVRCEHFILTVQKPLSKEYVALTVILVILLFIIVAGSVYYFCRW
ncbi:Proepiregulin, partial [Eschrichtius robustus]|nr:Proepiregulin [Eschrichtius robustus]